MRQELTVYSISVGLALAVIMGAANVYLGLKVGMTVSASIPAAVVSMLLLRVLLGRQSVLEANQAQTAASAGESLAAGIIFTMPALVLVGVWHEFDMVLTTLVALAGGLLGIVLMIPMRRVFVTADTLPFPKAWRVPQCCGPVNRPVIRMPARSSREPCLVLSSRRW